MRDLRILEGEIRSMTATSASVTPMMAEEMAIKRLFGWTEILDAIGRPDSDRDRVKALNQQFNGPMITRQGGDPVTD
jgi:hypothetical protein